MCKALASTEGRRDRGCLITRGGGGESLDPSRKTRIGGGRDTELWPKQNDGVLGDKPGRRKQLYARGRGGRSWGDERPLAKNICGIRS